MVLQQIAEELDVNVNELIRESVGLYLKQKLRQIDVELFALAKKYGVSNIQEFDELIKTGKIHEEDFFEDNFCGIFLLKHLVVFIYVFVCRSNDFSNNSRTSITFISESILL